MPKFTITSPDGQTFDVNAPEGSSESDAIEYVQKNFYKPKEVKQQTIDPTEGMTGMQKFLAGTGKAMVDIGRGAGQLVGLVDQKDIDESKRLDAPLMNTGAGTAGNVVGNIATALPAMFVPGANTVLGASAAGGVLGALQPVASGDSRMTNTVIGGVAGGAGQGIANAVGRAVQPVRSTLQGQDATLAEKARRFMPLNAAQETGSKPLRWIDSALDNLPFSADKQAAQKLAQREAWQSQLLSKAGENANAATPEVLGSAYKRLGDQFKDISARNTVTLGNDFINSIANIDASVTPFSKGVSEVVDKALDLASKGQLSGKEYQSVRSSLTMQAKSAWQSNAELGQALKTLRQSLDDAANASISAEDKQAWGLVREQYKNLKSITKATDSTTGMISPNKFASELDRVNPQGMKFGYGNQEVPDLARIGKRFVAETLPDSGSAQRSWYMNALQNPTTGLGLGSVAGFLTGGPVGAVGGAALGAATPLAVQKALWSDSGKKYLSKGLLDAAKIERIAPYSNAATVGLIN
jgi:hypothetical protein